MLLNLFNIKPLRRLRHVRNFINTKNIIFMKRLTIQEEEAMLYI